MQCPSCNQGNDSDAVFCVQCGKPMAATRRPRSGKVYRYALLVLPVIALAIGIGYYKFVLPGGVAAVVNGEEIHHAELEAAAAREIRFRESATGRSISGNEAAKIRYDVLSDMIAERIAVQEARKIGVVVPAKDIDLAVEQARRTMGMDVSAFQAYIGDRYGSAGAFAAMQERRLLVNKLVTEQVAAGISDPQQIQAAAAAWFRKVSSKAAVRISLDEQWSGTEGCACCSRGGGGSLEGAGGGLDPVVAKSAADAGIRYWQAKNGDDPVTARLTDFGCHIQVDIVKNKKIAASLRYQDGTISEL